jgi:hypothetical protein
MALKLRPPTHRADALGIFIADHDSAWDQDLYRADCAALLEKALAEKRGAMPPVTPEEAETQAPVVLTDLERHKALRLHPMIRYFAGLTRWQPDAQDWDPEGKPCTVRSRYLTKGPASEFTLRRPTFAAYQAADEIVSTGERLTAFARAALRAVKSPEYTWTAALADTQAPAEVIQILHDADPSLPLAIGQAVINLCRPLDDAEAFR